MDELELEMRAQKAGEERLVGCQEALFAEDIDPQEVGIVESPAVLPFCGCETCIVREVLDAAWPFLIELARKEVSG